MSVLLAVYLAIILGLCFFAGFVVSGYLNGSRSIAHTRRNTRWIKAPPNFGGKGSKK